MSPSHAYSEAPGFDTNSYAQCLHSLRNSGSFRRPVTRNQRCHLRPIPRRDLIVSSLHTLPRRGAANHSHSCIEHYFALIAACMPTLGPFFKMLRPNHWKHVAIGPQSLGNSRYGDPEAFERAWPRPSKTPSDDTLLGASTVAPEAEADAKNPTFLYSVQRHLSRGQTPQDMDRAWVKSDAHGSRKGDLKNEIELQQRDRGSESS